MSSSNNDSIYSDHTLTFLINLLSQRSTHNDGIHQFFNFSPPRSTSDMYTVLPISLCGRQKYHRTISLSLVKDESARKPERFITHQAVLGKFKSLILSFQAVDTASDSTWLNQRLMSPLWLMGKWVAIPHGEECSLLMELMMSRCGWSHSFKVHCSRKTGQKCSLWPMTLSALLHLWLKDANSSAIKMTYSYSKEHFCSFLNSSGRF